MDSEELLLCGPTIVELLIHLQRQRLETGSTQADVRGQQRHNHGYLRLLELIDSGAELFLQGAVCLFDRLILKQTHE